MDKKIAKRNRKVANQILELLIEFNMGLDVSIYFNNKAYRFTSSTEYTLIDNIKGSEFFRTANDDTVSMSFEGLFNHVINGHVTCYKTMLNKFYKILEKNQMDHIFGDAWNLSLYEK